MKRLKLAVSLLGFLTAAQAGPLLSVIVFGDSISDRGNAYLFLGNPPPVPLDFPGRFSNGPIWVDYLAQSLEVLPGGTNYATFGARTGLDGAIPNTAAR